MNARTAKEGRTKPAQDRLAKIVDALDECIRTHGIAAVTLTEIARAAGMSLSHFRYYFESKEKVIEFYLESVSAEILAEIDSIEKVTPDQWLEAFARFYVANPRLTRASVGVVIEIFGVSVHNEALARVKMRHDGQIRARLLEFFEWSGVAPGWTVEQAAYTAWCLEAGMKFNAAFQDDFSADLAGAVFLAEARRLCGRAEATSPAMVS